MHDTVLAFFRGYESTCNSANPNAAADAFAESFFYADRSVAKVLPRAVISAGIAQRSGLAAKAGLGPSVLERVDIHPMDGHYAWAATVWRIDPLPGTTGVQPVFLRATYLIEVRGSSARILAYISHTDFAEAMSKPE